MLPEGDSGKIKNSGSPGVSVIIVTYNAAATLQACLNSIYRQKYPYIEIVIIDGASTDDTIKIIKANSDKISFWSSEKDNGIYDAMNKGLMHITGDWVYFIGADDELLNDFSIMANELKDPHSIYYGSVLSDDRKCRGFVTDYIIAKYGVFHQAVIYPRGVFKKYTYDLKYKVRADHVLNISLAHDPEFHFIFKDYVIAKFNHEGLSNNYVDQQFEQEQVRLVYENFSTGIWLRFMFWRLKRILKKSANSQNA